MRRGNVETIAPHQANYVKAESQNTCGKWSKCLLVVLDYLLLKGNIAHGFEMSACFCPPRKQQLIQKGCGGF